MAVSRVELVPSLRARRRIGALEPDAGHGKPAPLLNPHVHVLSFPYDERELNGGDDPTRRAIAHFRRRDAMKALEGIREGVRRFVAVPYGDVDDLRVGFAELCGCSGLSRQGPCGDDEDKCLGSRPFPVQAAMPMSAERLSPPPCACRCFPLAFSVARRVDTLPAYAGVLGTWW